MSLKYPHLFEPIQLAGTFFKNRLFASPTGFQDLDGQGVLSEAAAAYYERKAMGGAASVAICEGIVDGELGRGGVYHICLDNPLVQHSLCRVAWAIKSQGAVASAELQHSGMYANRDLGMFGGGSRGFAYGPVAADLDGHEVRPMDEETLPAPSANLPTRPLLPRPAALAWSPFTPVTGGCCTSSSPPSSP